MYKFINLSMNYLCEFTTKKEFDFAVNYCNAYEIPIKLI